MRNLLAALVGATLAIIVGLALYTHIVEAREWGGADDGWGYSVGRTCRDGINFALANFSRSTINLEAKVGTSIVAQQVLTLSEQPINLDPDPTKARQASGRYPLSGVFTVPWSSPLNPSTEVQLDFFRLDDDGERVGEWEPETPYVVADCYLFFDLSIGVNDGPDPITPGGTLNYTLNVNNPRPHALVTETARDSFPADLFDPITIPDNDRTHLISSTIDVAGLTGSVTGITVTVTGLSHTLPDDLEIYLEGPRGQLIVLMSDAGGDFPIDLVNLVFDDAAPTTIPDNTQITSGTYRPHDWPNTVNSLSASVLPAPEALAGFGGTDPNGTWILWLADDQAGNIGQLDDWALSITTTTAAATVVDTLPEGSSFISASGADWACTHSSGVVRCTRSSLPSGAAPPITIAVQAPAATGTISTTAEVTGSLPDPDTTNNAASENTAVNIADSRVYVPLTHR